MRFRINLLTLPCAGASASMYLHWRRLLPEWIRLVSVELPGRGARMGEPCVEHYERLVQQICDEYASVLCGRYALFGHSMGALLAHGIAHRQQALARPLPQALFVSACPAPSRRARDRFPGRRDNSALVAELRKQGGTPEEVFDNAEFLRLTLDTLGADFRICESFNYERRPPFAFPIRVFAGLDDHIDAAHMEAWCCETTGSFSLGWFDGGHFFIRRHEAALLASIQRELSKEDFGGKYAADAVA